MTSHVGLLWPPANHSSPKRTQVGALPGAAMLRAGLHCTCFVDYQQ